MPWVAANPLNPHPPLVIARPHAGPGFLLKGWGSQGVEF